MAPRFPAPRGPGPGSPGSHYGLHPPHPPALEYQLENNREPWKHIQTEWAQFAHPKPYIP